MLSADQITSRLESLLGAAHVTAANGSAALVDLFGPAVATATPALAKLRPGSLDELQASIRFAAEHALSVWTTPNASGNGARFGNGAQPALLLDLARLDRVIEFDPDSAYALVEPGVSFDRLRAHISDNDLPFWVDCDLNGAHSVSGSICERAFGYTPYGDHLLMQCGMEVVLANGEVVRTGMGALPGNNTWQLFKYNFGPYLDGLFSRSDFAVVSKMGLWMMPAPPAYHPFMVSLPDLAALSAAVELLRPFKIEMTVPNTVVISHTGTDAALLRAAGDGSGATAMESGSGDGWNLYGALYGLPDNVAFVWQALAGALAGLPGSAVHTDPPQGDERLWKLRSGLMRGTPAFSDDSPAHERTLWFIASAPLEGDAALAMYEIAKDTLAARAVPFRAEFALTWRTLLHRVEIPYTIDDYASRRAAALEAARALGRAGYAITHDSADLSAAVEAEQTGTGLARLYTDLGRALDPHATLGRRPV